MTRIAIDYTSAARQGGGIGRYTRDIVSALARLDRENQYILLSADRGAPQPLGAGKDLPSNFHARSLPLTDHHLALIWQRLHLPIPAEVFTGRVDIFHSPDFVLPPVHSARTVLTVHDLSFLRHPECYPQPLLEYLVHSVPRSVARADIVLADSENTRRDVIELLGTAEDRVRVVYAGVDARFGERADSGNHAQVLRRYHIRKPYILGLGTLQPRKNFVTLIRAYHLLRQAHGLEHTLVIGGGEGWLCEPIYDTIAELGLHDQVNLAGFVNDADLPALYAGAAVFAFPSVYEGFGIPIVEAMACGTPVVASNASSIPEVAGDAALLVDPNDVEGLSDALWRAIDDATLAAELVRRGHLQVERFTWEMAAQTVLSVYATLS